MLKNQSRSVRKKIDFPINFGQNFPYPEQILTTPNKDNSNCFGEAVNLQNLSSGSNIKSSTDYDAVSFDKSSSSSLSWGEEYEAEATKKVKIEFERMERVLLGNESIPSNYDVKEYKLWIKTFPNLSVTGKQIELPSNRTKKNLNSFEEIIAIHPDLDTCDIITSGELKQLKDEVKSAVIDKVYNSVSKRLFGTVSNKKSLRETKKQQTTINISKNKSELNTLENQFEKYLRISPVPLNTTTSRRQSSQSVSHSHISASKWMRESSPEYTSLPFLPMEQQITKNVTSVSAKTKEVKNKITSTLPKSRNTLKNRYITLPPINGASLTVNSQFRSVSATPRNQNKTLSAISVQVDTLLAEKSRFEVAQYLAESDIRKSGVKRPRRLQKISKKPL